jgi:hypothetical protein
MIDGRAFNERMQETERRRRLAALGIRVVDLVVSDAVSSDTGGRSRPCSGAENGPQILSRPASPSAASEAERRERAAVLEGERRIAALEACLAGARSEAESHIAELEEHLEQAERERDEARVNGATLALRVSALREATSAFAEWDAA